MLLNCCAGEDSWSPLDSREIKPFNPKGIQRWIFIWRTDAEFEAPILEHLIQKVNSLEKTLMVGKIEGRRTLSSVKRDNRGWNGWMSTDMSLSKLWEMVKDRETWCAAVHGVVKSWTWLSVNNSRTSRNWLSILAFHLAHLSHINKVNTCILKILPGTNISNNRQYKFL